jgi:hypothetical protein
LSYLLLLKQDQDQEQGDSYFPDKVSALNKEDWSLCMATSLFFLEVIVHAIILLFIGLAVLRVLIIAIRTIVVSIVSMMVVWSLVIVIVLVASIIVAILVAMMLMVA